LICRRSADCRCSGERCVKISYAGRPISTGVRHQVWLWSNKAARSTNWSKTCHSSRVMHRI